MADDALGCFRSLLETVPIWVAELEDILKSAAARREEILFGEEPSESAKRPASKSSSLRSSRSTNKIARAEEPARPTLRHLTNSDALRLSQLKRKTLSVLSGDSSPSRLRPKFAPIVHYDGETQKHFEKLVRSIGSSRNTIRKGKMSAKVDSLSRSGSSCSSNGSSDSESDIVPLNNDKTTKPDRLHSRPNNIPTYASLTRTSNTEAFDKVDSRLEKAQSLCEKAAHQVLRDGDCTQEVSQAQSHFAEALRLAREEIPLLEEKAERAAARRRRSEERRRVEEEAEKKKRAEEAALKRILGVAGTTASPAMVSSASPPRCPFSPFANEEVKLEVDDLEVDSNEEDEEEDSDGEEFTIARLPAFAGKFSAMRGVRGAAAQAV